MSDPDGFPLHDLSDQQQPAFSTSTPTDNLQTGAPQQSDPRPPSTTTPERNDVISKNKENARAIMANNLRGSPTKSNGDPQLQNRPPSRKRSRSGSRIVNNSQAKADTKRPTTHDIEVDQIVQRDQMHDGAKVADKEMSINTWKELHAELDHYTRLEEELKQRALRSPTRPIYPSQRKRPGNRKTKELRVSREKRRNQADQVEELVPVRIDIEHEKHRLRDTFIWNIHDQCVDPRIFASGLVEDFRIPPEISRHFIDRVIQSIQEQLEDFHPHCFIDEGSLDPHLPYYAYKNDEMRIAIRLNITIGQHTLVDQFDWDVNNATNSPESFASEMARDLGLAGEFETAIAHQIREQSQLFTKSLFIAGHPFDGRTVDDEDVRDNFLPSPLPSVFRPFFAAKDCTPYFYELNDADLERQEASFSREDRNRKRFNRKGEPTLPDLKDRPQTWRTSVVSSTIPGCAETIESSGLYRFKRVDKRGRKPWKNVGGDGSDLELSESEESDAESAVRQPLQGTNRTRGMRGAASAAQAAMKANFARSQSPPELSATQHHHETRTLPRRLGGREAREDSEPGSLIVRLRLPREKFRQWLRDWKAGKTERTPQSIPTPQQQAGFPPGYPANASSLRGGGGSASSTPRFGGTPGAMGPPQGTPNMINRQLPPHLQHQQQQQMQGQTGRQPSVGGSSTPGDSTQSQQRSSSMNPQQMHRDGSQTALTPARTTPVPNHPTAPQPSVPTWLTNALPALRQAYPQDRFEGTMRWNPNAVVARGEGNDTQAGQKVEGRWQPRIRCHDCQGMMYNTDERDPTANFKVHLHHSKHKAKRDERIAREMADRT
ncbi:MAG: SWI/SNF chromatin-remodeling complex subunit [Alyxoria varia]|nr:MAG: SWI/SNF chromatin-remodeling complex subunit [Alyxoria varia]